MYVSAKMVRLLWKQEAGKAKARVRRLVGKNKAEGIPADPFLKGELKGLLEAGKILEAILDSEEKRNEGELIIG